MEEPLSPRNKSKYGALQDVPLDVVAKASPAKTPKTPSKEDKPKGVKSLIGGFFSIFSTKKATFDSQKLSSTKDILLYIASFLLPRDLGRFRTVSKSIYRSIIGSLVDLEDLKKKLIEELILEAKKIVFIEKEIEAQSNLELEKAAQRMFDQNTKQNVSAFILKLNDTKPLEESGNRTQIEDLINLLTKKYQRAIAQNRTLIWRAKKNPALAYWLVNDPIQHSLLPPEEKKATPKEVFPEMTSAMREYFVCWGKLLLPIILFFMAAVITFPLASPLFFLFYPPLSNLGVMSIIGVAAVSFLAALVSWGGKYFFCKAKSQEGDFLSRHCSTLCTLSLVSGIFALILALPTAIFSWDVSTILWVHFGIAYPIILFFAVIVVGTFLFDRGKLENVKIIIDENFVEGVFFLPIMIALYPLALLFGPIMAMCMKSEENEEEEKRRIEVRQSEERRATVTDVASKPSTRWIENIELSPVTNISTSYSTASSTFNSIHGPASSQNNGAPSDLDSTTSPVESKRSTPDSPNGRMLFEPLHLNSSDDSGGSSKLYSTDSSPPSSLSSFPPVSTNPNLFPIGADTSPPTSSPHSSPSNSKRNSDPPGSEEYPLNFSDAEEGAVEVQIGTPVV